MSDLHDTNETYTLLHAYRDETLALLQLKMQDEKSWNARSSGDTTLQQNIGVVEMALADLRKSIQATYGKSGEVFLVHMVSVDEAARGEGVMPVRPVVVPHSDLDGVDSDEKLLEVIFYRGQNDRAIGPLKCYSVSVGDIAELGGDWWLCDAAGWTKLSGSGAEVFLRLTPPSRKKIEE